MADLLSRLVKSLQRLITSLLRLAFQGLYYPLAPLYDQISYYCFLGQWSKWQQAVLPRIQGKRVLEVGCGTGTLLTEMLRRGFKAYGVDASPRMLAQADKKLTAAGFAGRALQARVQKLPFPDESFETVVSTFPSEYIVDLAALQEIQRVLYPGGRLVIVDGAELKPFNLPAKILIWVYRVILGYGRRGSTEGMGLPLAQVGLIRRDETFEDERGEAHIIIALKSW